MICDSCGASYKLSEYYCPYCQSENPVMAEIRKEQILKGYDVEAEQMKDKIWAENLHKWTRRICIVMGVLVAFAVILLIGSSALGPIMAEGEYAVVQKHLEHLEKYYQAEDWENMQEYLWDKDCYDKNYEKYSQITDAYMELNKFRRELSEMLDIRDAEPGVYYYNDLEDEFLHRAQGVFTYAVCSMQDARRAKNDRVILGNEDILQAFYDEVVNTMAVYDISEAELLEFINYEVMPRDNERLQELKIKFTESFMQQ